MARSIQCFEGALDIEIVQVRYEHGIRSILDLALIFGDNTEELHPRSVLTSTVPVNCAPAEMTPDEI